ncbi:TIGR01777 family oxidoreductase [Anaerobacillus isosaccharinicus]|uniref:TIGR01777 family protein n=1 Tax=Anaerobacillus isosaccharinicus TaxID=1532552 RepID=A0A1S2KXF2_9BACI|nr:TIGR01777 family oxidoreductase [Anaerobacillus isosaccharinicus]MBA5586858.1 TIGR01777 family protein [Anaerobacillus isosaccharinicus]QOY34930.1 TIGR01777 family protein [Anaerobacillus isosaccharinicus]
MSRKIILAGGSGFLGTALAEFLSNKGYQVVILSRTVKHSDLPIKYIQWDGVCLGEWANEIDGSYAIVNFTGKSVNCIYTKKNKKEIISSRLNSVKVLDEAIRKCEHPPEVIVQAGSLAIFGDTKEVCHEEAPHGSGFSVDVCQQWEEEFFRQTFSSTRQVLLRIGFALGKNGGALEPLKKLTKLNLGGTVGSGKQYISWLHIDDLNEMFLTAIENNKYEGIFNATSPTPITNKEFMKTLRDVMGKGWTLPAPTPFVWLGAYAFMQTEPSLALTGRNCIPKKLQASGFTFKYTDLETALKDLIHYSS